MRPISYQRHRFPVDVIRHAVWLCFRFTLSFGAHPLGDAKALQCACHPMPHGGVAEGERVQKVRGRKTWLTLLR